MPEQSHTSPSEVRTEILSVSKLVSTQGMFLFILEIFIHFWSRILDLLLKERRELEFSIYLKNHNLKVVDQASQIANKEETIVSKQEYQELIDSQLSLSDKLQALLAEKTALKKLLEDSENSIKNKNIEKEKEKEETLKLCDNIGSRISQL